MRVLVLLGVLGAASVAGAQAPDVAPLLESLRPSVRADLPSELGPLERLPYYELDMTIANDLSSYTMRERIEFTNTTRTPMRDVVVRIFANSAPGPAAVTVRSSSCGAPTGSPTVACRVETVNPTALRIVPARALAPGGRISISLELEGRLRQIDSQRTTLLGQGLESLSTLSSGERQGDYGLLSIGDGIASFANFYGVVGRRERRGWVTGETSTMGDLGSDAMSFFRVRVTAPRDAEVIATGRITQAEDRGPLRVHTIAAGLVRDFALVASRGFASLAQRVDDVTVRSHFLPRDRASGQRVLDAAVQSLAVFEQRFGPYPYRDLDVVEASLVGGAGGVEFSGLVTVASMLYRPIDGDLGSLASLLGAGQGGMNMNDLVGSLLEFTTAHEVAHQYWHGLVGSDSRAHPFVDESLAQYSAMLYFEDRYGAERAEREANMQVRMNYQTMRMLGHPDGAVDRPVDDFGTPVEYAGLVYGKGPYLYPELRRAVDDEVFFRTLREYVRRYRFRVAPQRGFVDMLAAADRRRVRAIARRWLDEAHGDEDLGQGDLGSMLGNVFGQNGQNGPNAQQLGEIGRILQGLQGSNGQIDEQALQRAVESILGGGQGTRGGQGTQGGGANDLLRALEALTGGN
jgi:hypothetical protein